MDAKIKYTLPFVITEKKKKKKTKYLGISGKICTGFMGWKLHISVQKNQKS